MSPDTTPISPFLQEMYLNEQPDSVGEGFKRLEKILRDPTPYFKWNYSYVLNDNPTSAKKVVLSHTCGTAGCAYGMAKLLWGSIFAGKMEETELGQEAFYRVRPTGDAEVTSVDVADYIRGNIHLVHYV